jgi:nickel-dependent lactate racemase
MQKFRVYPNYFFFDGPLDLTFPDSWDVKMCKMACHDKEAMTPDDIKDKMSNPIGTDTLGELAKNKKEAAILVDDMSRITNAGIILPHVLEELNNAGISDDHIRIIIGCGSHGFHWLEHLAKKVGGDILERINVFNHTPWMNLVEVGKTSRGNTLKVNKGVMDCDLKISVGSIDAHGSAGYSGGAKMIIPGISGIDTICYMHRTIREKGGKAGMANITANDCRFDMEEAARMVGLDFILDAVWNGKYELIDLFCGDVVDAHRAGCERVSKAYATELRKNVDVSVSNVYSVGYAQYSLSKQSVKEDGDIVALNYNAMGMLIHRTYGRWGMDYGGPLFRPGSLTNSVTEGESATGGLKANGIIVVNPFPHSKSQEWRWQTNKVQWVKTWDAAMEKLSERHGDGTKVAIYPTEGHQRTTETLRIR